MTIAELIGKIGFEVDTGPLEGINKRLDGVRRRLDFLSAVEVIKGIAALTERFSQFAEGLTTTAAASGLSVEALQKLQFAAGQSGVGAEDMAASMNVLARKLYDAQKGGEEAQKSFAAVGISPGQLSTFGSTKEALEAIADQMADMSDPIAKQAMAMDLLGRGGSKMVALLSGGGASLRQAGESAARMGAIVSGPAIYALGAAEDSISGLWQTVKAFSATVAAMFAPAIIEAIKHLQGLYAANHKVILLSIKGWAYDFAYVLGSLVAVVEIAAYHIIKFAKAHPELVKRIGEVIFAVATLAPVIFGLLWVFRTLKDVFSPVSSGLSGIFSGFKLAFKGADLLKGVLGKVLIAMGSLVETFLPGLSAGLISAGAALEATPLGWAITAFVLFAAAIAGTAAALKSLYDMLFNGKDYKDTALGKMEEKLKKGFAWLKKLTGIGGDDEVPEAPAPAEMSRKDTPTLKEQLDGQSVKRAPTLLDKLNAPALSDSLATAQSALGRVSDMAQTPPQRLAAPPMGAPAEFLQSAPTVNNTMNAPITINVPPNTPLNDVAQKAKDAIAEHLGRLHRETQRSVRTAQVY